MAIGFSEAVQWWEEWQLRVLVLASLFLRCFLFFAGILRKRCIPSWLRFLIWLAYLSSDAVAIYALANLFNRPNKQEWVSTDQSSTRLQVLWAPILLIHLGGQDSITAYNIEDNELWRRHVLTAVSQVAVAVYVFRKSSPENTVFMATGVLLFVAGILKCVLKPWDLKRVSINSLVDSSRSEEVRSLSSSQENYVRDATRYFQEGHRFPLAAPEDDEAWKPYDLFVDLTPHHLIRLSRLKALVHAPADKAQRLVRNGLSVAFDRLYTKEPLLLQFDPTYNRGRFYGFRGLLDSTGKLLAWILILRLVIIGASFIMVMLTVLMSESLGAQDHPTFTAENYIHPHYLTDAMVTYILITFTVSLEFVLPMAKIGQIDYGKCQWPDQVAQYNLIGYLVRNKKHKKLGRLATLLVCKDYVDQLCCMKPSKSSHEITKLVHSYIAKGWKEHHIKDIATYRDFNDNRGQWTLNREGCGDSLAWSLERPFDESVLLWHLATDFCFHLMAATPPSDETARRLSKVMSNYMVYLLFVNPEMLMTGARRFLFREAYRQLKEMLKLIPQPEPDGAGPSRHDECEFARNISQNIQHASATVDSFGLHFTYVHNAWRLAQQLQNLPMDQDHAKMWKVIQGVWVEMLCFSAGRCRGYLHAKSLGKGGEYLSYIWLLMSYMGMETLAERMQTTKLNKEDARNNGGSSDDTTAAASSSSTATGRGSANGTTAAIPVPAAAGGHGDVTTEASSPVTEGGNADGTTPASPVMTTTDLGGDGRTAASSVTTSGDENV